MSDHGQASGESVTFDHFMRVDIRVGTVLSAEEFAEARVPAYRLTIDFGDLGMRRSSAQITKYYSPGELVGKQVVCVLNFPPKRIAGFVSEVLVLGAVLGPADVVLLGLDRKVPNGARIA
jgi:tRNA-binding protein